MLKDVLASKMGFQTIWRIFSAIFPLHVPGLPKLKVIKDKAKSVIVFPACVPYSVILKKKIKYV